MLSETLGTAMAVALCHLNPFLSICLGVMSSEQLRLWSLTSISETNNIKPDAWSKCTAFAFLWGMDGYHSTFQAGCFVAMRSCDLAWPGWDRIRYLCMSPHVRWLCPWTVPALKPLPMSLVQIFGGIWNANLTFCPLSTLSQDNLVEETFQLPSDIS